MYKGEVVHLWRRIREARQIRGEKSQRFAREFKKTKPPKGQTPRHEKKIRATKEAGKHINSKGRNSRRES